MRTPGAWAVAAVVLATASAAWAQEQQRGPQLDDASAERRFKERDTNSDGKLTVEEFTAGASAERAEQFKRFFAMSDLNKDGSITLEEQKAAYKRLRETFEKANQEFAAADVNTDNKLTVTELTAGKNESDAKTATELFTKTDLDNDGFITKNEWMRGVFTRLAEEPAAASKDAAKKEEAK